MDSRLIPALMLGLVVWTVMTSPVLAAFYFIIRRMRRRSIRSAWRVVTLAFVFTFLAAPVPTPIVTVFIPHAAALLDRHYYDLILHGPAMFKGLWPWIAWSLALTFIASLVFLWRFLRPAHDRGLHCLSNTR